MAKTMQWLHAILNYMKKGVDHINGVWPSFLTLSASICRVYGVNLV